ncbi:hypothetical protein QJQ45_018003, partial [Haematococcus lacustris]
MAGCQGRGVVGGREEKEVEGKEAADCPSELSTPVRGIAAGDRMAEDCLTAAAAGLEDAMVTPVTGVTDLNTQLKEETAEQRHPQQEPEEVKQWSRPQALQLWGVGSLRVQLPSSAPASPHSPAAPPACDSGLAEVVTPRALLRYRLVRLALPPASTSHESRLPGPCLAAGTGAKELTPSEARGALVSGRKGHRARQPGPVAALLWGTTALPGRVPALLTCRGASRASRTPGTSSLKYDADKEQWVAKTTKFESKKGQRTWQGQAYVLGTLFTHEEGKQPFQAHGHTCPASGLTGLTKR